MVMARSMGRTVNSLRSSNKSLSSGDSIREIKPRVDLVVCECGIGLLASFIAPFIEPLAGNDAAPFLEMFAELPLAHAVGADIKQRWPGFIAGTQPVNAGPREDDALPCDKDRDKLRRRDVRLNSKLRRGPL